MIDNLAFGAAFLTSILVATGTIVALIGGPSYRLTPDDQAGLQALGLTASRDAAEGHWGSASIQVAPGRKAVFLSVHGLPGAWKVYPRKGSLATRTVGDVVVHRRTRERLEALDALTRGGSLTLANGRLELEMPRHAAATGQLPRMVEWVRDVIDGLSVAPEWRAVALDAEEETAVRLVALQHLVRDDVRLPDLAHALAADTDPVMVLVSRSLLGDPSGLQAWCEDHTAVMGALALPLLPMVHRCEAMARRLARGGAHAHPFAEHLRGRLADEQVSRDELGQLTRDLRMELEKRLPMFGLGRFEELGETASVIGPLMRAASAQECEGLEDWVDLLLGVVRDADAADVDDLLQAISTVATVRHVPAIQGLEDHVPVLSRRAVHDAVRAIQAKASGQRGGVALAPAMGGEVALTGTASSASQPSSRPAAQRARGKALE